ncbi:hypothetical protein E4U22_007256 [Claviceps purpurea]|nr:hypothetical protein E4U35_000692 [Claviceps purpurea]KAG6316188.1 hypothetical protein E4U22_007256 [Claviceps purpurea]
MLPTRFSSVRQKCRDGGRGKLFRDDSQLIGLRYEKTKPAEPPLPLPPAKMVRNHARRPSSPSSLRPLTMSRSTTTTSASRSVRSSSVASSCYYGPAVVVAPPREQHPALRCSADTTSCGRKRDSGHAAVCVSESVTIHEEDEEDEEELQTDGCTAAVGAAGGDERRYPQGPRLSREGCAAQPCHPHGPCQPSLSLGGDCRDRRDRRDALERTVSGAASAKAASSVAPASAAEAAPPTRTSTRTTTAPTTPTPPSPPSSPPPSLSALPSFSSSPSSSPSLPRKLSRPGFRFPSFRRKSSQSQTPDSIRSVERRPMEREPVAPLMRGSSIPAPSPTSSPSPSSTPVAVRQMLHDTNTRRQTATSPLSPSLSPSVPATSHGTASGTLPATPDLAAEFAHIAISIPTESLLDHDFMTGFVFSKRGSLMFGGKRATMSAQSVDGAAAAAPLSDQTADSQPPSGVQGNGVDSSSVKGSSNDAGIARPSTGEATAVPEAIVAPTPPPPSRSSHKPIHHQSPPDIRILSPDIEKESQKVRSLYETSDAINWEDGARFSFCEHLEPTPEVPTEEDSHVSAHDASPGSAFAGQRSASSLPYPDNGLRREYELAGGLEDWEDVDGADVDRYGFILPPRLPTSSSRNSSPSMELKSAQYSPRRRHLLQKRDPMGFASQLGGSKVPSRKVSARSLNTVNSERSGASMRSSRSVIRTASNFLPHNRNRRWMDEAGDMLTVSPNLQDSVEEAQVEKISESLKRKEWERSEKWRKMAKVAKQGEHGEGMEFEFDARHPKLIERTWKGIPDRWRGAAWWSFLETSARETKGAPSADDIVSRFRQLQETSSPDDTQIDLDVPRTISRHIMFRRRYRGGQRLLFRVLHALSIYFPETGYVQGMASLAATLLCYFDEEKAFVMLVRMWQLRGLERLYRPPDFQGLMIALREFDQAWLSKPVAEKLAELDIHTTAYGTKWYLTLFNLSIPFPAQLRVWDVFLLLGDTFKEAPEPVPPPPTTGSSAKTASKFLAAAASFNKVSSASTPTQGKASGLDILHAASAALIEALREVLLDSDFENAMKALTSWIPVKDEDLLMKVTKAEWKTHQGRKRI